MSSQQFPMSTSTTLMIPHELVATLRDGLHAELADAAGGIIEAGQTAREDRRYGSALGQFDGVRRLLDLFGWTDRDQEIDVPVDLVEHRQALMAALRGEILSHEDLVDEADAMDGRLVREGRPPRREQTLARAGALGRLADEAEARLAALGLDDAPSSEDVA
jgi:hypothetical protein